MTIKDFVDVIISKISALASSKFTGSMTISLNFNSGGITRVRTNLEEDVTNVDKIKKD